jgi:hypothetical protein
MQKLMEFLSLNPKVGTTLFYPGSGDDFQPLSDFISGSSIDKVYYVDYNENINLSSENVIAALGSDWYIIEEAQLTPKNFNQNDWTDFWYNIDKVDPQYDPTKVYGFEIVLKNKLNRKLCHFHFLRTEAIKTFLILFNSLLTAPPDVIVLQDHGFGGNWGNQVFGYGEDNNAKFYGINKVSEKMPPFIYVAENTHPWPEYEQITDFEGSYGSAGHRRALFQLISI